MQDWLFTPAYCKAQMLEDCLKQIYSDPNMPNVNHVIIDNHYPVDKDANRIRIQALCSIYGCTYIDSEYDRGLHEGLNRAMQIVGVKEDDFFCGCDPDDRPSVGWITALKNVMQEDPLIAVLGLNFWVIPWKKITHNVPFVEKSIQGHGVWYHPDIEMWNVAAFNLKLIFAMGGFKQPNAYYGGLEVSLHSQWQKYGMKLAYLKNYTSEAAKVNREDPNLYDKAYGEWKVAHAHYGYKYSFEEWLKEKAK